ncbi:Zinc finger CCHC domain-containing protein 12, partial [Bienertia sinuspersici]
SKWGPATTPVINPPEVKRIVGRPPWNKRREPGEQKKGKRSVTVKCSKCGEMGHNKNGCTGGLTAKQKKAAGSISNKKRGREEGISTQGESSTMPSTKKKKKGKQPKN